MGVWWEGAEGSSNITDRQRPSGGSSGSSSGNRGGGGGPHFESSQDRTPWSYTPKQSNIPPKGTATQHIWDSIPSTQTSQLPAGMTAAQQAALSMQAAGQITGGMGGGRFTTTPVQYDESFYTPEGWEEVYNKGWSSKLSDVGRSNILFDLGDPSTMGGQQYNLPEGMYYDSNLNDGQGGYVYDSSYYDDYNDQGGGGWGGWGGYGGGGGGYGGGGGGYAPPEDFTPRGQPNEAWGQQDPMQQMMISLHGGKGFQQGFARGGIVSLVT